MAKRHLKAWKYPPPRYLNYPYRVNKCVKLTNPMNFMFNWPFALKKDRLDLEVMMLLLGAVLWSEVFLQSAETLHLDEGTSVGIQFCWTLQRVHMCALHLAWMFFFSAPLWKKTPEATASISKQSAVSKEPSKSNQSYLPGLMKWLLALKER